MLWLKKSLEKSLQNCEKSVDKRVKSWYHSKAVAKKSCKRLKTTHTNNQRFRESEMAVVQTGKRLFGEFGGWRRAQEDLEN